MSDIPRLQRGPTGRLELIVDGRPLKLVAGEFHNSASSCLQHAARVFSRYRDLCCNAALVPITWELLEPEEGRFDFELVDGLLSLARSHGMRLVPLWFGTFKNTLFSATRSFVRTAAPPFDLIVDGKPLFGKGPRTVSDSRPTRGGAGLHTIELRVSNVTGGCRLSRRNVVL